MEPNFWDSKSKAGKILKEKKLYEDLIQSYEISLKQFNEIIDLYNLALEENNQTILKESENNILELHKNIKKNEIKCFLSNEADSLDAYLEIHAGAGGTESQDWAEMLRRMYMKWASSKNYKCQLISEHKGDEAGIKSSTIKIDGNYIYGFLKSESGIHRLVRISPFDSGARRHTSFASIWVYPVIDESIKVEILDKDLRIDTYRSSGAGGQHVNTTDSAVRITHVPTKIVVQCQNDRSQHKNKATAETLLKAKIYDQEQEKLTKQRAEERKIMIGSGDRSERIRTYNFPQGRVTDHRIGLTLYNLSEIMEGEITELIETLIQENAAKQMASQAN